MTMKTCSVCGDKFTPSLHECPRCHCAVPTMPDEGEIIESEAAIPPVMPEVEIGSRPQPELKGVGGWLFFFCVVLTLLNPVATFASLNMQWKQMDQLFDQVERLKAVMGIETILALVAAIVGVNAGLNLWWIKQKAVSGARRTLIFILATGLLSAFIFRYIPVWPETVRPDLTSGFIVQVGASFVPFGIWYSYLKKSVRVKNTYSEELAN